VRNQESKFSAEGAWKHFIMDRKKHDIKTITAASKTFEKFYASEVFSDIIDHFTTVCELLEIQSTNFVSFYPELKENIKSCQGQNLFKLLEERANKPVFGDNMAASNTKMMVIGAGPIGLRTAIEAQLLGARVTVIEKRTSFTRNNVLHLWPWVIEDLKSLGAKSFYPRFCTGTMNHISIRRLQCILLKTALIFGVEVFGGVEFKGTQEPDFDKDPWTILASPEEHPVCSRPIDIVIGAEGKRVTLPGFRRKEFRGKLAIAITANFVNKRTTAEAVVEEISGVAFVYKQDFFNNLYDELGIALENIVYYKDETHYFVMTTKKHSLLDRKVLKQDLKDPIALLSPKNVNKDHLYEYIKDACDYCTDYQLPKMEFALNHYNQPDVALFDFTSMFASANASHVVERKNSQLLFGLVGDGLLEPFWPTGTGIARGFLGAMDCCWMLKQWASGDFTPSEMIAERESILKMLPATTQENITKDYKNVTVIPKSRYPNLPRNIYSPAQVDHLYDSDVPQNKDVPRYAHPSFQEISSKPALRKKMARVPVNSSARFSHGGGEEGAQARTRSDQPEPHINPSQFYKKMMEERGNKNTAENSSPTLQDRLDAKRSSLEAGRKGKQNSSEKNLEEKGEISLKTILNSQASKADFVKKMSKTFGYGMPSNAEQKSDTLASEAEKCALMVKPSNRRKETEGERREEGRNRKEEGRNRREDEGRKEAKSQQTAKPRKKKSVESKNASKSSSGVEQWDFGNCSRERNNNNSNGLHSSVAKIDPTLDIEIDPELDWMLAELENDETFSRLPENDQKTWIESLFFQDTLHAPGRQPRDSLNKTKPNQTNMLRVNAKPGQGNSCPGPPAGRRNEDRAAVEDPEASADTSIHVNNKMKDLAQNFFKAPVKEEKTFTKSSASPRTEVYTKKSEDLQLSLESLDNLSISSPSLSRKSSLNSFETPPTSRKPSVTTSSKTPTKDAASINESMGEISGINKNLCSLAQSYFSGAPKPPAAVARKSSFKSDAGSSPAQTHRQSVRPTDTSVDEEESGKASLVASFFGGGGGGPAGRKLSSGSVKVRERASYEPESSALLDEEAEEDQALDLIIRGSGSEVDPPPPPPRKLDKQALMLRMMGNVNGILAGKKK